MKQAANSRLLESFIFLGVFAAVISVPLAVFPGANQSYTLPKFILLAFIVVLMLMLAAVRSYLNGGELRTGGKIGILVVVFLGLAVLSYWQSIDKVSGLYGHYGRHDGLLAYLIFAGLFIAVVQITWWDRWHKNLLTGFIVSGTVVASLAIIEYLGFGPIGQGQVPARVAATLGNPVFLGSYLAVVFVCSLALALAKSVKILPGLLWGAAGLSLVAIALTASRSAILGLFFGIVVVVVYKVRHPIASRRLIISLAAPVVFVLLLSLVLTAGGDSPDLFGGFSSGRLSVAVANRVELARGSLKIITDRPLFGAGPSNFPWAYQKVQSVSDVVGQGRSWRSDDAHNLWLQVGASLGFPALAVLAAIIVLFLIKGWRLCRVNEMYLPIVGGMVALLVTVSFEPISITSFMFFWLFIGIVAAAPSQKPLPKRYWKLVGPGLLIAAAGAGVLITFIIAKVLIADINYQQAQVLKGSIQKAAADKLLVAITYAPHVDKYYLDLGELFTQQALLSGDEPSLFTGISFLEQATVYGQADPENWIKLALAYKHGSGYRNEYVSRANEAAETAIKLSPNLPAAHRCLGEILLDQGQFKTADKHLRRAVKLDPNYGEGWLWLGLLNEKQGRFKQAEVAYGRAGESPTTKYDAQIKIKELKRRRQSGQDKSGVRSHKGQSRGRSLEPKGTRQVSRQEPEGVVDETSRE